jgi:hypothetical protein
MRAATAADRNGDRGEQVRSAQRAIPRSTIAAAIALLVASSALADTAPASVSDIEACVARNLPNRSGTLSFAVRAWDRAGTSVDSRAELFWLRHPNGLSNVLLRLSEPEDTRGTSVLVVQNLERDPDLYVYLPELSKVKRVRKGRLRGPLFGTDFSYEDFERVQGIAQKTKVMRLADQHLLERPVWALEVRPSSGDSAYDRIVTLVDQSYCLPLRMDFYASGKLRKVLTSDPTKVRKEGDHYVPYSFVMQDVRDETRTVVTIERARIDPGLDEEIFTASALLPGH